MIGPLDEGIRQRLAADPELGRLIRGLSLSDHFHLYIVVLQRPADAPFIVSAIRTARSYGEESSLHEFSDEAGLDELLGAGPRVTVLDFSRSSQPNRVQDRLRRLNERRNVIVERLGGELVLLLSPMQEKWLARTAPDLWSIRSGLYVIGAPEVDIDLAPFFLVDPSTEKLEPLEAEVDRVRTAVKAEPEDGHLQSQLLRALLSLALAAAGRSPRSVEWAEEALGLAQRSQEETKIARAYAVLGATFNRAGKYELAVKPSRSATDYYRALAKESPRLHRPNLASSLASLGGSLSLNGQTDQARPVLEEAVELYRRLVEARPDAHLGGLAGSIVFLCVALTDFDELERVIRLSQEAANLYLRLNEPTSGVSLKFGRIMSLQLQTRHLALAERFEEAIDAGFSATTAIRKLTAGDTTSQLLAAELRFTTRLLRHHGREAEAALLAQEAVDISRKLMKSSPSLEHCGALADSLVLTAAGLFASSEHSEMVRQAREAVELYRELVVSDPEAKQAMARSLYVLGAALELTRKTVEARRALEEAIPILRDSPNSNEILADALAALTRLEDDGGAPDPPVPTTDKP